MSDVARGAVTREGLRGNIIGIAAMLAFAGLWAYWGLSVEAPYVGIALAMALFAGGSLLIALWQSTRGIAPSTAGRPGMPRAFWFVLVAEIVAINLASSLTHARHPTLLAPLVAVIVGLHFFPLARVFRVRAYLITGAVLTLWGAIFFFLGLQTDVLAPAALGASAILVLTCVVRYRSVREAIVGVG